MSDFVVRVRRSHKRIREKFWVTIQAGNGEPLFHSEQLRDRTYALELGARFAEKLDATRIDET